MCPQKAYFINYMRMYEYLITFIPEILKKEDKKFLLNKTTLVYVYQPTTNGDNFGSLMVSVSG